MKVTSLRSNPLTVVVCDEPAMYRLQVLDGSGTPDVEEVLANAAIARTATLPPAEVSEAVLHGDAFADTCATVAGLGQSTEALLEKLAVGDRHRTAIAGRGGRALITQFAAIAGIRIELDIGAEIDRLDLASWTRDGAVAQVDQEVSLAVRVSRRRSICSRLE